ncbi:MAG: DegT/DnrJ/EryC1/StrS family aminotransferase [Ilumatobacteraceae bacterium]
MGFGGYAMTASPTTTNRIPVAGPWVTDLEVQYVAEAAANDWYATAGQSVGKFEREFAEALGVAHAAAVPHCTSALHLAYLALGIGPGDEVIVPEATWVATAAPLAYVGATPVFADIDPDTWCVSAHSIEQRITPNTKAIVTVDLYGSVPDMDALGAIAQESGLPIVEDAAQAIGSSWNGRLAGTLGDIATFSFHGTKTLTTGEGGMLVTDRSDLFERVARLRDHGRTASDFKYFSTNDLGYKYRMGSLPAAFGRAQLSRLGELLERKQQIFGWYEERLTGIPGLRLNDRRPEVHNTFWMVTIVLDREYGLSTRGLMGLFDERQIDTRPLFPPLSALPAMARYATVAGARERNPVAYDIADRSINLPSALMLTEDQVDRVCTSLRDILSAAPGGPK